MVGLNYTTNLKPIPATKTKLSITISNHLAHLIEMSAETYHVPKSQIIERAIKIWHDYQLEEDAKKIAALEENDPETKAWLEADLNPLNEWEWKE